MWQPLDCELLAHYYTEASLTIHCDPEQQQVWQVNVPELAFAFDFVRHGILAFSAFHLAYLNPQMRDFYLPRALEHNGTSLSIGRKLLQHVTEENCSALFIFTILVTVNAIAGPRKPEDFLLVEEAGIASWLKIFRGTGAFVGEWLGALRSGPGKLIIENGLRRAHLRWTHKNQHSTGENQLEELKSRVANTTTDQQALIYSEAIDQLRESFTSFYLYKYNNGATDAFDWTTRVSEQYLHLLRQQTQESLCIFIFFCVLLHQTNSNWWMEGWSTHLVEKVCHLLDEEHRQWVWWPLKQLERSSDLSD